MPIQLTALIYRSPQRVRLVFSEAVGATAFQAVRYEVTCLEPSGSDVDVRAALLVPDAPHVVELALRSPLVGRSRYQIACTSVPAATSGAVTAALVFTTPGGAAVAPPTASVPPDVGAVLYGVDLVWNGTDIAEGPGGDLATVSGLPNAEGAIKRVVLANGLPWDPAYGAGLRGFVDGAPGTLPEMIGNIKAAVQKDDRIRRSTVVTSPVSASGEVSVTVSGTLIGDNPFNVSQDVGR